MVHEIFSGWNDETSEPEDIKYLKKKETANFSSEVSADMRGILIFTLC